MKKAFLSILLTAILTPAPIVYGQSNLQIAIGNSNTDEDVELLTSLFGEDSDEIIKIDGNVLNEFLQDGSDESTGVFSSVSVEFLNDNSGVDVEILTPENIIEVPASTYRNAAIAAGAKNVKIQIAASKPVTGHGALAGVYQIFADAGMDLQAADIANAENLINIEQLLSEETNMKDSEISKFIAEYHIAIINLLEAKKEVEESDISDILSNIISNYNYSFSEGLVSKLTEYGYSFSRSDAANDPETKSSFEKTLGNINEITKTFKQGYVEVTFTDMYFTNDRNEFMETNYDHVLVLEYDVKNNSEEFDVSSDYLMQLYVNDTLAEQYFLDYCTGEVISPGRNGKAIIAYGFNGNINKLELELSDINAFEEKPILIEVPETITTK